MFLLDNRVVYSPTDLAIATQCEFALLRRLDAKLHRAEPVSVDDPLMARAAELGDGHERRVLAAYVAQHGDQAPNGVVQFPPDADYSSAAALHAIAQATLDALRAGAAVVYQGSFFDGRFFGRSDFLERRGDAYAVLDTKLARHAKVPALLQLAAYADQLQRLGVPLHPTVGLVLGNGERPEFPVQELIAVYRHRRARLEQILDAHHAADGSATWDDGTHAACGRCDDCSAEAEVRRDVLLVAGLRTSQRIHLKAAGVTTVEELAAHPGAVPGIGSSTLERLRHQARLQAAQHQRAPLADGRPDVHAEVVDEQPIRALPTPDPGDLFFDFEGDPLWDCGDGHAGLEYLFGVVEADTGKFRSWVAHDRAQEKQALVDFLDYVTARRTQHPNLRIYHYAAYERAALTRLAARHQVGEEVVDDLLRQGVLVDLYSTVRRAVRVSQPSYSIKKLEPLYMGDELRTGVDNAAESVVEYARYTALVQDGDTEAADAVLKGILDYNAYDCLSTLRLRDWLIGLVPQRASEPATTGLDDPAPITPPDPLAEQLRDRATQLGDDPDATTLRMLAAAIGYHQREDKPFWWERFARLREPVEDWADGKDVFVVDEVLSASSWEKPTPRSQPRRRLRLAGTWGSGSVPSSKVVPVFAEPVPEGFVVPPDGCRAAGGPSELTTSGLPADPQGRDVVEVTLALKKSQPEYDDVPIALLPDAGPSTAGIRDALRELATASLDGTFPTQPGLALLRRLTEADGQPALPADPGGDERINAVTEAVRRRAGSYVAVQGPPGTGKTYLGARVVKQLVKDGWRIGVVAQSHLVISHFLDAVIEAGVPADRVGKKDSTGRATDVPADGIARFLAIHAGAGCVVGGTVWDFVNTGRVGRGELDLLVVDEAGQFCLANTLAASVAAKRLLLLGDPQQLPQVSQGTHPEPVDDSALGWLMQGAEVLPAPYGYFLPETWRMHPALCAKVSDLSYDGQLHAEPSTAARHLEGIAPGVHAVPVTHAGNDTASPEEAAEVVALAQSMLGRKWTPSATHRPRELAAADLLVVAAYNTQVVEVRRQLAAAGLADVLVGTVDKIQGREAPVVIVSLAASSAAEVPRGVDFLLNRNRLNVAVSRGQWAAFVVHSPALADHLPASPTGLQQLGAYLTLHAGPGASRELAGRSA